MTEPQVILQNRLTHSLFLHELGNAGAFYDRGFFLPLGEAAGAIEIDVHACEGFAVTVVHGHAPMVVLAATVFADLYFFAFRHLM